jgi:hypothetical protein
MKIIEIIKTSCLVGCRGSIKEERYGNCFVIEFTYVPNHYFHLPCVQVIDKKHIKIVEA